MASSFDIALARTTFLDYYATDGNNGSVALTALNKMGLPLDASLKETLAFVQENVFKPAAVPAGRQLSIVTHLATFFHEPEKTALRKNMELVCHFVSEQNDTLQRQLAVAESKLLQQSVELRQTRATLELTQSAQVDSFRMARRYAEKYDGAVELNHAQRQIIERKQREMSRLKQRLRVYVAEEEERDRRKRAKHVLQCEEVQDELDSLVFNFSN